jgi:hypothetical protein
MLTMTDIIGMSELSAAEVAAIAKHEHVPEVVACEIGNYLIQAPDGTRRLEAMLAEEAGRARARGDTAHGLYLQAVLDHFRQSHPGGAHR